MGLRRLIAMVAKLPGTPIWGSYETSYRRDNMIKRVVVMVLILTFISSIIGFRSYEAKSNINIQNVKVNFANNTKITNLALDSFRNSRNNDNFVYKNISKVFYLSGFPGDIKSKDFNTGEVVTLVSGNAGNFDISKDGQKMVYASNKTGAWQIYIADVNKDKLSNIRMLSDGISRSEDPRLSWDNSKVVYKRNGDIVVCALDGSIIQEITNTPDTEEWAPNFAPDGRIAYTRGIGDKSQIVVWDNSREQIEATGWYPAFGDDGSLYFIGRSNDDEDDIYRIPPGSTYKELLPINASGVSEADPHWVLGTNKWLVFNSERGNDEHRYEGYIADITTNKVFKIISDTKPVFNPIVIIKN
ncbi:WD40-like Beta Propeller Repeat [Thermoanaerobacterium sp. RBIITD]|nr:WD40-like Beta Propeller Repeat [Thermoanaerobacterium sp. RBIITD]